MNEGYALDTVKWIPQTQDISWIPQHIIDLYLRYDAVPYSEWKDLTTPAQKRTRTMRFDKFCAACTAAGIDAPSALFDLTNAKANRQI